MNGKFTTLSTTLDVCALHPSFDGAELSYGAPKGLLVFSLKCSYIFLAVLVSSAVSSLGLSPLQRHSPVMFVFYLFLPGIACGLYIMVGN